MDIRENVLKIIIDGQMVEIVDAVFESGKPVEWILIDSRRIPVKGTEVFRTRICAGLDGTETTEDIKEMFNRLQIMKRKDYEYNK